MRRGIILYGLLGGLVSHAVGAAQRPTTVSPGGRAGTLIESHCPTFSWGPVARAKSYELVIYILDEDGSTETQVVLRKNIPGGGLSWTPSMDRCLEAGREYAWVVRGRNREGSTDWSRPRLFEVAAGPSEGEFEEALAVVRAYLQDVRDDAPGEALAASPAAAYEEGARDRSSVRSFASNSVPQLLATPTEIGLRSEVATTTGVTFGVHGVSNSTGAGSAGTVGQSTAGTGDTVGVVGQVASAAGSAGLFDNTAGGDILRGLNNGTEVFTVDGAGEVTATGFSGDGSMLTGVPQADDVNCVGCVSEPELGFDTATQSELDAHTHPGGDITSGTVAESLI